MTIRTEMPKASVSGHDIVESSTAFFDWLACWYDELPSATFHEICPNPSTAALLVEDLLIGFCREGPLASDRVDTIVQPTAALFQRAYDEGVTRFVVSRDVHDEEAPEFEAWPPHCVRGTKESDLVPEIAKLPFASQFRIIEKNSLSTGICTDFEDWLTENSDVTDYVVTGDCTDLCTYALAMHIRMWANAGNLAGKHVIVPASTVQTYDLPVSVADGTLPHPGDFTHMFFLYHMALNGIRVVSTIT